MVVTSAVAVTVAVTVLVTEAVMVAAAVVVTLVLRRFSLLRAVYQPAVKEGDAGSADDRARDGCVN